MGPIALGKDVTNYNALSSVRIEYRGVSAGTATAAVNGTGRRTPKRDRTTSSRDTSCSSGSRTSHITTSRGSGRGRGADILNFN